MDTVKVAAAFLLGFCIHAILDRLEGLRGMETIIYPVLIAMLSTMMIIITSRSHNEP